MRVIVFFDLPMESAKNRRDYAQFHKFLIKTGFIMMQKSVYTKLSVNNVMTESIKESVEKNCPSDGIVEMLEVTERQFLKIKYVIGEKQTSVIDSMDRLIEL
ncbi:MAG: CRISPR-associated endonuclease Cas2 [Clostridia bacterium]|nr:CRISPR-associated endonuclease Cas2 [Clostridia bacterium]